MDVVRLYDAEMMMMGNLARRIIPDRAELKLSFAGPARMSASLGDHGGLWMGI